MPVKSAVYGGDTFLRQILAFRESGSQCQRELVRTRCPAKTALCSLEFLYDIICFHAVDELGDSFCVAVAAADEADIFNDSVLKIESDFS